MCYWDRSLPSRFDRLIACAIVVGGLFRCYVRQQHRFESVYCVDDGFAWPTCCRCGRVGPSTWRGRVQSLRRHGQRLISRSRVSSSQERDRLRQRYLRRIEEAR